MSRQMPLFATGIFLQVASSSIAQAQAPDPNAILELIGRTADRICYVIADKGSASGTEVQGAVNVELSGFASRLAEAGVKGTGSITNDEYQGVLQKDLPALMSQSIVCRQKVFESLQTKLITVAPSPLPQSDAPGRMPTALPGSYWDYDGSLVHLDATPTSSLRLLYFYKPNAAMMADGARPGDLLFSGRRTRDSYAGTAYAFFGRCGTVPYTVTGSVLDGDQTISISGQRPNVDRSTCQRRSSTTANFVLRYRYRIN